MSSSTTFRRASGTIAVALVVAATGAAAAMGMTSQERHAMLIRGQALNKLYGNGLTRLSPAELRALTIRSEALNQLYGGKPVVSPPAAGTGDGFDWGEAGIGVATAFGVSLLGLAGATAVRRRSKVVQPRF